MTRTNFTGGLRTSWLNATWPFARMSVDDEGIVVRVLGFIAFRSEWPSLTQAEHVVGGLVRSHGVRLTRTDGQRIVFWTFHPEPILNAVRLHGVPAPESGTRPKIWFGTGT